MHTTWDVSRRAFADAAAWFLATVGSVGHRWSDTGLGEWDIRALVGHTSRSFLTVEAYLAQPAPAVDVPSAAEYFRATRALAASRAVAERGREAGLALGTDPVAAVTEIATRVLAAIEREDGTAVLTTLAGGMRLSEYLPTRTFELTVHTADLATALERPLDVPPTAGAQALGIVSALAVSDGSAGRLLLAATGRPIGPDGLSVL